jgi:cyclic-di-GMP-binding protein
MAAQSSFDITSPVDFQEVDNALNQARKEVAQRYDFKGAKADIIVSEKDKTLTLAADDEFKMTALWDIIQSKLVKRNVPIKNFKYGDSTLDTASMGTVKRVIAIQEGIPIEAAREIVKYLKDKKLKKVQASIQGDQVRVTSASRDDLQEAIRALREHDFGIALQYGNYR